MEHTTRDQICRLVRSSSKTYSSTLATLLRISTTPLAKPARIPLQSFNTNSPRISHSYATRSKPSSQKKWKNYTELFPAEPSVKDVNEWTGSLWIFSQEKVSSQSKMSEDEERNFLFRNHSRNEWEKWEWKLVVVSAKKTENRVLNMQLLNHE